MDRGDFGTALSDITAIDALEISPELKMRVLETKARLRIVPEISHFALATLTGIIESSDTQSLVWQTAQLAKTDILLRNGDTDLALEKPDVASREGW